MSLFLTDIEQWYDGFDQASPREQYALIREAIAQPIPIQYAEEIDFGSVLLEVWDRLVSHNLIDEALALRTALNQQQPDLYQKEFQYIDGFLVQYRLFHNQFHQLPEDLARFKANPDQGIDQLIPVLDDLRFYGATEPLVDLCRAAYLPVATSRNVIGGTEIEFGTVVILDLLEQAYQQLQQGDTVDWEALGAEAAPMGLKIHPRGGQMLSRI